MDIYIRRRKCMAFQFELLVLIVQCDVIRLASLQINK